MKWLKNKFYNWIVRDKILKLSNLVVVSEELSQENSFEEHIKFIRVKMASEIAEKLLTENKFTERIESDEKGNTVIRLSIRILDDKEKEIIN